MSTGNEKTTDNLEQDFHGAAIISEDGKELPITEDMVQDACHKLEPEAEAEDSQDENTSK